MTAPLPLTRRLLAALPRFREATTDREERAVALWCGLDAAEVRALSRLCDQWRAAGPLAGWFVPTRQGLAVKPAVLAGVLAGFDWREDAEGMIARALGPRTPGEEAKLMDGLAKERKKGARSAAELRTAAEAEVARRGVDLLDPPPGLTAAIARELDANETATATVMAALKREERAKRVVPPAPVALPAAEEGPRVVLAPAPAATNGNGTHAEARRPSDPLRDLRAVLLEEGLKSVEPEALREPLRRLLAEAPP